MRSAKDSHICLWTFFCLLTLRSHTEGLPTDIFNFDAMINRTTEAFNKIYDPIADYAKDVDFGAVINGTTQAFHKVYDPIANYTKDVDFDAMLNRTSESFYEIYDPVANYTKDFVGNISEDRMRNCSIVVGGALAGAGIGVLAFMIGVPLVLCLFGFTCWGIMAGTCAACCQSSIGDVPAGSCFACLQSLGAGGMMLPYFVFSCIVGIPLGLYLGGLYSESQFHCFTSP